MYSEEFERIKSEYPKIKDFECWILTLASENHSYGEIQKIMGNPSKKEIRKILLKYNPELINDGSK